MCVWVGGWGRLNKYMSFNFARTKVCVLLKEVSPKTLMEVSQSRGSPNN